MSSLPTFTEHILVNDIKGDEIKIKPIGDIHLGNPYLDEEFLESILLELEEKDTYWVGVGDYFELATKKERNSGVFEATMSPQEQLDTFVRLFKPFAHKCLAMVNGNHDDRLVNEFGISPVKLAGQLMGVEEYVHEEAACFLLNLESTQYSVYMTHGDGSANTVSGKVSALDDLANSVIADLIIGGHTHMPFSFRDRVFVPASATQTGGNIPSVDRVFVNTGGFLQYGGYTARNRMRAFPPSCPTIFLSKHEKQIRVLL